MKRRDFVKQKMLGAAALGLGGINLSTAKDIVLNSSSSYSFKLNYAPHLGMWGIIPLRKLSLWLLKDLRLLRIMR